MNPAPPLVLRLLPALLIGALAFAIVTANPAVAQCAQIPDTARALRSADTVFVGRVVSLDGSGRVAEMEVTSIWKGRDLPTRVEVRGASASDAPASATDRRFDVDATYLVIAENSREPFLASACSATQKHAAAANLIPPSFQDAVGATTGRSASVPTVSSGDREAALTKSILPLLGAIVLIALVWFAIDRLRSIAPKRLATAAVKQVEEENAQKPQRVRRRSFRRDAAATENVATRKLRRHARGFGWYRRRIDRQVAAARKASGSNETS